MHVFPDATPEDARSMMDDLRRGAILRWAAENLPLTLSVAGGMMHAFARSTDHQPAAQRRLLADTTRRAVARPAGRTR